MLPHIITKLPIYSYCEPIIEALKSSRVVIVAGDTGTGKSTVLPFLCLEAGLGRCGRIAVTQPRRIAAITLAYYAASLDGTPVGKRIGYKIRYSRKLENNTSIVYMTDGILLASLTDNTLLKGYDAIIIDEAHERSMNIDFLLAYMRKIFLKRPELRCIITSATLDTQLFSRAFGNAPVITIQGRKFNIEIQYRPVIELWKGYSLDSFIEGAIIAVENICNENREGDILIFLPTIDDVIETVNRLHYRIKEKDVRILPLHSRLSRRRQQEVFGKHAGRKIVVATNIAETSLTVPDIRFVIDTGLVRILRYEPAASISRMPVEKVSRASADQRAGRCGRTSDGLCIRLYSEQDYLSRPRFTTPEIRRANLAGAILRILALDAGDPYDFPFLQKPSAAAFAEGLNQLQELGAIDRKRRITPFGRIMARFPLDPAVSCMLLRADGSGAVPEVLVITAALSVQEPLDDPEGGRTALTGDLRHPSSDFMTYLNVWQKMVKKTDGSRRSMIHSLRDFAKEQNLQYIRLREWFDAYEHLKRICKELSVFGNRKPGKKASYEAIHKSLLAGLSSGVAYRKDNGVYEGITASEIRIASSSVTAKKEFKWLLFHEIVETDHVYGRRAALIDPKWVEELFGHRCRYTYHDPHYDPDSGTVRVREEVTYRSLPLVKNRMRDYHKVDRTAAREVFVREALVAEGVGEQYRFIRRNRETKIIIAAAERKLRKRIYAGDEALESFYEVMAPVATRKELNRLLHERGGDSSLIIPVDNLLTEPLPPDFEEYRDEIIFASYRLPVDWEHSPGSPFDGATVTVPQELAVTVPQYWWEWQLPVFCKARIALLVKRLLSNNLKTWPDPAEAIEEVVNHLTVPTGHWMDEVRRFFSERFGFSLDERVLEPASYPVNLWLQVRVVDDRGLTKAVFRPPLSFWSLKKALSTSSIIILNDIINDLKCRVTSLWTETPLLQPYIHTDSGKKFTFVFFPALSGKKEGGSIEIFTTRNAAYTSHAEALRKLLEERLSEQLTWEIEAIKIPAALIHQARQAGFSDSIYDLTVSLLIRSAASLPDDMPRTAGEFEGLVKIAVGSLPGLSTAILSLLERIFKGFGLCRLYLEKKKKKYSSVLYSPVFSELEESLNRYRIALGNDLSPIEYIRRLPRYLEALPLIGNEAILDPAKFRNANKQIAGCRKLIDEAAGIGDYFIRKQRWKLLDIIEQYCFDQFAGTTRNLNRIVTAAIVEKERTVLAKAVEEFYRE